MEKTVLLILVGRRKDAAVNVQKTLTAWGCLIKTRLGLHTGVLDNCSDKGLIFCELMGEKDKINELRRKLELIKGIKTELVTLSLDEDI
jgi:hypothetical protein